MTASGWLFMLISLLFVLGLNVFCFYKVLVKPAAVEELHAAPPLIDTKDEGT